MAQRGLSASTIAADAVAEGVLRASTQIAAADAQTYKEMIFQNLSNNSNVNKCSKLFSKGYAKS